jgi:hypothetical protein
VLRFVALVCTVALTVLAVLARRIADADVPVLTPLFDAVLPGTIRSRTVSVIVTLVLQSICYTICHFYLKRL